ncbi:DUF1540 domain-containing protein [Clostridium sp. C105KSO13]|uniref:DUF1540 domain-containing protein n=1 Tax=Clostridium sp. C105KSO13 TaxID=1776045 RepID=UPI0007407110|nr:DUF1540 domain-containing protein [Clostridium sp. C105KSO13]CUX48784.1 hypothetical protein BN3456_02794 [Clostridium sp. C105KSO13]
MPDLKCTVQTCTHNKQFLCDLDKIQVGGNNAKSMIETSCDSFQERAGEAYENGSYSNSYGDDITGNASDRSDVDCEATACQYNDSCKCQAGKISVEGSNACHSDGTACATFEYRG